VRATRAYFLLSAKRDAKAAERFFRKVLKARHTQSPRLITVDKNAAYPKAIETLKGDETRLTDNTVAAKEILEQYH
jgi:transposase-like protein